MSKRVLLLCEDPNFVSTISNHLVGLGHIVTNLITPPATISFADYDHCWVLYYGSHGGGIGEPLTATRTKLATFMSEGGMVFLATDHAYNSPSGQSYATNEAIKEFLKIVIPSGVAPPDPFTYIRLNSNNIDSYEAWNAGNAAAFGIDTTTNIAINNTAVVETANLLGGTGLLNPASYSSEWGFIGYSGDALDLQYRSGSVMVFLDRANALGNDSIAANIAIGFIDSIVNYEGESSIYSSGANLETTSYLTYESEVVQPVFSTDANLYSNSLLTSQTGFINIIARSDDFYLRNRDSSGDINYISGIPESKQFSKISDLQTALIQASGSYVNATVNIHFEGGALFPYEPGDDYFDLTDFDSDAIERINFITYHRELSNGGATLLYNQSIINNTSTVGELNFDHMKIFILPPTSPQSILDAPNVDSVNFGNSILQIKQSLTSNMGIGSVVNTINCLVIAEPGSGVLQLTQSQDINSIIANSPIIVNEGEDVSIKYLDSVTVDTINQCLAYNYASGYNVIFPIMLGGYNIVDIDPLLINNPFTVSGEMYEYIYSSKVGSPLINSGSNSLYTTKEVSEYDIEGLSRIFRNKLIDRSPYESQIFKSFFYSNDILRFFQGMVIFKENPEPVFTIQNTGEKLKTLYDIIDIDESIIDKDVFWSEFFRGSKCIIQLRDFYRTIESVFDKDDILIGEFECYFDSGSNTILFRKTSEALKNLFTPQYNNGRYKYFYDGEAFKLYVYINNTYFKGASGVRNPVNRNKFGGNPVIL